jgi:heme-degrading monooxygenase HmoA
MLRRQPGLLVVLFLREAGDHAASVTIWEDGRAVEALECSPSYRGTARELAESGLLAGERSVEAFEVAGGILRPEPLILSLGATEVQPPPGETAT